MNNVMLDNLPSEYEGCKVNTDFRIGIQLTLIREDEELTDREKTILCLELLFSNEDGTLREMPTDIEGCLEWFISGWFLDNATPSESNKRIMDYDIDQWRIYADFLSIYRIDLSTAKMHWWMFQGLLWNMPTEQSSFMQCLQLRTKKPHRNASTEERKAIAQAHERFDLKDKGKPQYTSDELQKIDEFDRMMAERKESIKAQLTGG